MHDNRVRILIAVVDDELAQLSRAVDSGPFTEASAAHLRASFAQTVLALAFEDEPKAARARGGAGR